MGRPTTYEPTEVLRNAADLFRRRGFHGSSIQELVEATGMSRFSIYDKFGSKEGLFYSSLEFYVEVPFKRDLLSGLLEGQAAFSDLLDLLTRMRALALRPEEPAGCLIVNASIELGGRDVRVEQIYAEFSATLKRAFLLALSNAEEQGKLSSGRNADARAAYLVTMTNAFMMLAHVSRSAADDFMQVVIAEAESWQRTTKVGVVIVPGSVVVPVAEELGDVTRV